MGTKASQKNSTCSSPSRGCLLSIGNFQAYIPISSKGGSKLSSYTIAKKSSRNPMTQNSRLGASSLTSQRPYFQIFDSHFKPWKVQTLTCADIMLHCPLINEVDNKEQLFLYSPLNSGLKVLSPLVPIRLVHNCIRT